MFVLWLCVGENSLILSVLALVLVVSDALLVSVTTSTILHFYRKGIEELF